VNHISFLERSFEQQEPICSGGRKPLHIPAPLATTSSIRAALAFRPNAQSLTQKR